jgi:hypothetical protein
MRVAAPEPTPHLSELYIRDAFDYQWGVHRALWVTGFVTLFSGCEFQTGPSEQRLRCLSACAREKDGCVLSASTAEEIRWCDTRSRRCNVQCPG